jgi:hypothetical protein
VSVNIRRGFVRKFKAKNTSLNDKREFCRLRVLGLASSDFLMLWDRRYTGKAFSRMAKQVAGTSMWRPQKVACPKVMYASEVQQ